jgi:hypothetical protein
MRKHLGQPVFEVLMRGAIGLMALLGVALYLLRAAF